MHHFFSILQFCSPQLYVSDLKEHLPPMPLLSWYSCKPPSCCHPLELGCATPSTHREKFAQLHQQQWQLNEVVLWLWALTSPRRAAKPPARGWERKVQVREWSSFGGRLWLFPEADLGHWVSFSPSAATSLQSFQAARLRSLRLHCF